MKTMLCALIVLAGLASTAHADIMCATDQANKLSVLIKTTAPGTKSFYEQTIPVEVTFQALRLYYKLKTTMVKTAIQTRLGVGINYSIDLGSNYSIKLKDIDYAPIGYEHLLGFSGVYVEGLTHTSVKLKCVYK